jgi:hypothetical protein
MKRFTDSQRAELIGLGFEVWGLSGAWKGVESVVITDNGFYRVITRKKKWEVRTQYIADFDKAIAQVKKYRKIS